MSQLSEMERLVRSEDSSPQRLVRIYLRPWEEAGYVVTNGRRVLVQAQTRTNGAALGGLVEELNKQEEAPDND